MRSHEWIDQRSLALDRAVLEKLRTEPALLAKALATLEGWMQHRGETVPAVWQEWHGILTRRPLERIAELLAGTDETARRLRQSSPFCGILTPAERLAIFKDYESRRT